MAEKNKEEVLAEIIKLRARLKFLELEYTRLAKLEKGVENGA